MPAIEPGIFSRKHKLGHGAIAPPFLLFALLKQTIMTEVPMLGVLFRFFPFPQSCLTFSSGEMQRITAQKTRVCISLYQLFSFRPFHTFTLRTELG